MLELGPGAGALVLHAPPELDGREIEVSGAGGHRTHALVRQRRTADRTLYAAIYPGLASGEYTIWRDDDTAAGTVQVAAGQVTSMSLAESRSGPDPPPLPRRGDR